MELSHLPGLGDLRCTTGSLHDANETLRRVNRANLHWNGHSKHDSVACVSLELKISQPKCSRLDSCVLIIFHTLEPDHQYHLFTALIFTNLVRRSLARLCKSMHVRRVAIYPLPVSINPAPGALALTSRTTSIVASNDSTMFSTVCQAG